MGHMARRPADLRPLTHIERRFAQEYSLTGNAAASAKAAGIAEGTAHNWLKNESIQTHIRQRQKEAEAEANLTRGRVIQGLLKEAEGSSSSAVRVSAWTSLARIIGLFEDKHVHSGNVGLEVKGQVLIYLPDNGRGKESVEQ